MSKTDSATLASEVSSFWDEHVGKHLESFDVWEANYPIKMHQNKKISGDPSQTAVDWFWCKYGPFRAMASIGSGTGILESHVAHLKDPGASIVGFDISPRSVQIATENCRAWSNVFFEVADVNTRVWPRATFDATFAHGTLHHVERLDHCLGQVSRALKRDGLLYVNDYIGPSRFQWSDVQMRLANELLATVPRQWVLQPEVLRFEAETVRQMDPSEAVNSQFIEDAVRAHFRVIERRPRGGTLLMPIFGSGCLDREMLNSAAGLQCLADLAAAEERMIEDDLVPAYNVVLVARPR